MSLQPGAILRHRYRIKDVLGQGGMGAVYRGYDINLGVAVAVKENLFTTEDYARQFRREATILASLRHPNLPRVTDHFVIEGEGQYLVMDYIGGEDLRQRLERGGPVTEAESMAWFLEICDALSYLHSRSPSILHRDIKPGNIKITPDSRAILVDFGLAKVVDDRGNTTTGAKAMTPGFSPPEQYGTGRTDARTDVYALGATIYAALAAAIPEDSLERAMGREELTPLRKRNPRVSGSVSRAVEKALAVVPDERYQSINEFASALSSASGASRPTVVRGYTATEATRVSPRRATTPLEPGSRIREASRRRNLRLGLGVTGVVVVVAGLAFGGPKLAEGWTSLFGAGRSLPTSTNPVVESDTPGPTESATPGGIVFFPTDSPTLVDGATSVPPIIAGTGTPGSPTSAPTPIGGGSAQIGFASSRVDDIPQVFLINIDGTDLVQLTNVEDGACQPDWSPDGLSIIFTSPCLKNQDEYPGSSLWLMKVDGSSLTPLTTAPGGDFDPVWSPDGQGVAFTSLRDGPAQVYVMRLDGSGLKNLTDDLAHDRQPVWSPTGSQLLFVSRRLSVYELWTIPSVGGDEQRFSRTVARDNTHPDWSNDGQLLIYEQQIGGIPRIVASRFADRGKTEFQICPQGRLAAQPMAEPHLSPDSRWLTFETWPTGIRHDIAIMTTSCTNYRELTSEASEDFDSVWRPR
ncbi:MAG TPA: protein kinase [Anaerolineales bacterium]|nr:protein kinase [Anaerolineales bacterium]